MSTYERTPLAIAMCLALVVAAFLLFIANFEWPTSRMVQEGVSITERDILVYDALPIMVAGYVIGLGAIAITRFIFPRSSIKLKMTGTVCNRRFNPQRYGRAAARDDHRDWRNSTALRNRRVFD